MARPGLRARRGARSARAIAAAVVLLIAGAVWADRRSRLAEALRSGAPIAGAVTLRYQGQGRVVPPALYLALYHPAEPALDLVRIPPETPLKKLADSGGTLADVYGETYIPSGDVAGAGRRMARAAMAEIAPDAALTFHFELDRDAQPAAPKYVKRRLVELLRRPRFWLTAWQSRPAGMGAYDGFILAQALRRLPPERIFLSILPEPALVETFLSRLRRPRSGEKIAHFTVEILNASGRPGVALKATKILRLHGVDVVHFGNAQTREKTVRILDRVGAPDQARRVLQILGCRDTEVVTVMETRPQASATILLGRAQKLCVHLNQ